MVKKTDKYDMESMKRLLESDIVKRYKPSFSSRLNDFMTGFLIVSFLLLLLVLVMILGITLIENPISLAILMSTILLIIMWGNKK